METKQYHLVTTGGGKGKADWEVHKANCTDVLRQITKRQCNAASILPATSPEELINRELAEELAEMGYSKADFKIFPCCKEA